MSLVDRFSRACVRFAAGRWPAPLRDGLTREWLAELRALCDDPSLGALTSTRRRLGFAVSLACSPSVDGPGLLGVFGRAGRHALLLGAATLATIEISIVPPGSVLLLAGLVGFGVLPLAVAFAIVLALTGAVIWILGSTLGHRWPGPWSVRSPLGVAWAAALTTTVVGVTTSGVVVLNVGVWSAPASPAAMLVWIPVGTVTLYVTVRLLHSGHRAAVLVGLAGMTFTLIIAAALDGIFVGREGRVIWAIFGASTLLFAYTLGAHRTARPGVAHRVEPEPPARRWVRGLGLSMAATGVLSWASVLAVLTPRFPGRQVITADLIVQDGLHVWVQELRCVAVLLSVLGIVLALSDRARVALPATVTGAILLATDLAVDAADFGGVAVGVLLTLGGGAVLGLAYRLGGRRSGADLATRRRTLILVAVTAAVVTPALLLQDVVRQSAQPAPRVLVFGSIAVVVLTWLIAGTATIAARRGPMPRVGAVMLFLAPPLVLVAAATVKPVERITGACLLAPALVVLALAVIHPWTPGRPAAAVARWSAATLAAIVVSVPFAYAQVVAGYLLGGPLAVLAGEPFDYGRTPRFVYAPGAILWGLGIGAILAARLVPGTATTAPSSPPEPEEVGTAQPV